MLTIASHSVIINIPVVANPYTLAYIGLVFHYPWPPENFIFYFIFFCHDVTADAFSADAVEAELEMPRPEEHSGPFRRSDNNTGSLSIITRRQLALLAPYKVVLSGLKLDLNGPKTYRRACTRARDNNTAQNIFIICT